MAAGGLKPVATLLLLLNFCMCTVVAVIGGWVINVAVSHGFTIGTGFALPSHFSPVYLPVGNAATGFFALFAVIPGVVGAAAAIAGLHVRAWDHESLPAAASSGLMAWWALTLLAMGFWTMKTMKR